MKQNESDFKDLSLKDYYDKFCRGISLEVVKRAYCYSQNGHLPQSAIATASLLFAEPFKKRDLLHRGFLVERELNSVTVWNLQTETISAQRALLQGQWDYHNHPLCIARLGENYACTRRTTLEFPSNLLIGVHNHRHRFVAVVCVEEEHELALNVPKVQELANIVAKNAIAYYAQYLEQVQECKRPDSESQFADCRNSENFKSFLFAQPLLFVEGVNCNIFFERHKVTVGEFIAQREEQLEQKLDIASIDLFGDF